MDIKSVTVVLTVLRVKGAYRLKGFKDYFAKKGIFLRILQRTHTSYKITSKKE